MNSQTRTFVKQVQLDLLALSDTDLSQTIHQWVDGKRTSGQNLDVPEDTLLALGYSRVLVESETGFRPPIDDPEAAQETPAPWQAPSSSELRALLTAMDANLFAQHVITLAYKALHAAYPEWFDGLTFNAHLANYLRQIRTPWPPRSIHGATSRNPYPTR